ncbi:MAG: sigma-70 family RNA polymerase sigma factor [Gemmataceae bacterium]|nr:sigma-70 family RNA polymerase sigma factor [Gemmataceae bacterium]
MSAEAERTSREFVQALVAARKGDRTALGRLLDGMRSYLLAVVQQDCVPSKSEAEDLVQETLVKAYKTFDQFHGTTALELRGWLRRIALNNARDTARHWHADKRHAHEVPVADDSSSDPGREQLPADIESPIAQLIRQEKNETIQAALEQMNAEHVQVILLRWREGLHFDEIGRRLGRSSEAARKLWERALQQLRRRLQEMRGEDSDFQDAARVPL